MVLYSYCIPVDDGAAPNPFWGICTLVICKPVIRRNAEVDDWIVATGSKNAPGNKDFSKHLVYAMKVSKCMPMKDYDVWCKSKLPEKIPDVKSNYYERQVGDCIYDFSKGNPTLRLGVHDEANQPTDIGGVNALLSDHFYYFGNNPVTLPPNLHPIIKNGQAHRSISNEPYKLDFIDWLESNYGHMLNKVINPPQIHIHFESDKKGCISSDIRCKSDRNDEKIAATTKAC